MNKRSGFGVTPQGEDFSAWFNQVVVQAGLVDHGLARGSMVLMPLGCAIWELIQDDLNRRLRHAGVKNVAFPSLIPQSFLEREAEHVEGFAPDCYVVTHAGGKELEETLVLRPTSETVVGHYMARWITSHRDLPMMLNQWANVFRSELRSRLLLRTTEFLWQEGHTAHANEADAMAETIRAIRMYEDFARNVAAIPVQVGEKTANERFAGALRTLTIEAMMRDGKALQSGTSHYLGENFARAFGILYADTTNAQTYAHTTSWGLSTRMLGAVVMAHGDDKGLVLPPRLAPVQVVIVPIGSGDMLQNVANRARLLADELEAQGIRVELDDRSHLTPGRKFNEWELKGVPVRLEIGPRDLAAGVVTLAYRIGSDGKQTVAIETVASSMQALLDRYHLRLLERAESFRNEHTVTTDDWAAFSQAVSTGWALAFHCGSTSCEVAIREETGATARCIPDQASAETGTCVRCGEASAYAQRVYFAKAY